MASVKLDGCFNKCALVSLQDAKDIKDVIFYVWMRCLCYCMYERNLLYKYSFETFIVVYFNVSSTKFNARARLSRYVWYGCYIWYQSRSIQTVPWVIKLQLR
jgi:hypothetical protein